MSLAICLFSMHARPSRRVGGGEDPRMVTGESLVSPGELLVSVFEYHIRSYRCRCITTYARTDYMRICIQETSGKNRKHDEKCCAAPHTAHNASIYIL